jgi:hypothetical protein
MPVMLGFAYGILGWRPIPVAIAKHHQIPAFAGMTVKIALAKRSYQTGCWGWMPVWRSRASQGKPDQARALFERNRA